MRVACIIQARMGSRRLPGKVQMDIGGRPMIWHVEQRVRAGMNNAFHCRNQWFESCETVVAWPSDQEDENDVLGRYYRKATEMGLGAIVRVTGDCPLMAPEAIQRVLCSFQSLLYDYVANDIYPSYPDGLGVECFSYTLLERAHREASESFDREHVTPWIKRRLQGRDKQFEGLNIICPINGISDLRLSVNTQADLNYVRAIDAAGPRDFSLKATLEAIEHVKAVHQS